MVLRGWGGRGIGDLDGAPTKPYPAHFPVPLGGCSETVSHRLLGSH